MPPQPSQLIILPILLITMFSNSYGQRKNLTQGNQQWFQYYNSLKFSGQWGLDTDLALRKKNQLENWSQILLRSGLSYQVHENIKSVTGFAGVLFYAEDNINRLEWRPYQQFTITHQYGPIATQHRFRAEGRIFRELNNRKEVINKNFNYRFRYRIFLTFPLVKGIQRSNLSQINFKVGDEIFLNAGKDIIYNIFNHNRLLAGPALVLNDHWSASLLYQHQFAKQSIPSHYNNLHIIWLGINHKLKWD